MQTALKVEIIKTKSSNYLKIALILPLIFLIFTLMTLLSSQNPTGLSDGISIIQTNIFNLWSLILLPFCIVMIINSDYQQENRALGWQQVEANNWPLQPLYWSKTFKYWLLLFLSHLTLVLVVVVSNLLTTKVSVNAGLLLATSLVLWLGSLPLIVINMHLLRYLNAIIVSILNLALSMGSAIYNISLSHYFWIDPWSYASRTIALLRIQPNGTSFSPGSFFANDVSFIYLILLSVSVWLLFNYFLSFIIVRKRQGGNELV
ncbi:MAG: hypothetical protein J6573_02890 [Lactobacillus sp.]|nr:hypothetical protein [Lactobacillus sp.]